METFNRLAIVIGIVFVFAAGASATAQAPPTPDMILKQMGIGTDYASLINALTDGRPPARSQAAGKLGDEQATQAIPAISAALQNEENPKVIYSMTTSLAILGSQEGVRRLRAYCADREESIQVQMGAAETLSNLGNYSCLETMAKYISSTDEGAREGALLYLDHLPAGKVPLPTAVVSALFTASKDADPFMRDLAAKAILKLGDASTKAAYLKQSRKQ